QIPGVARRGLHIVVVGGVPVLALLCGVTFLDESIGCRFAVLPVHRRARHAGKQEEKKNGNPESTSGGSRETVAVHRTPWRVADEKTTCSPWIAGCELAELAARNAIVVGVHTHPT